MWPTDNTVPLLIVGLLPLAVLLRKYQRAGLGELASLRSLGILSLWVGYHLSPWIAVCVGSWYSFLLVPSLIDMGLLCSTLAMCSFLAGYELMHSGGDTALSPTGMSVIRVQARWLITGCLLSLTLTAIVFGGIDNALMSDLPRGYGQFDERLTVGAKAIQMISIALMAVNGAVSGLASVYILQGRSLVRTLSGLLCIAMCSMGVAASFSRGSGFAFGILAFLTCRFGKPFRLRVLLVAVALMVYLSSIGWLYRGSHRPGILEFASAAATDPFAPEQRPGEPEVVDPDINPLNAMDAWSRKASLREIDSPGLFDSAARFLWNLHPFPSDLVPLRPLGTDLAVVMGTMGSSGITTPALGEMYYAFGLGGAVIFLPIGLLFAFFDARFARHPGLLELVCLVLCCMALAVGLHSNVRTMTRPLVYASVAYGGSRVLELRAKRYSMTVERGKLRNRVQVFRTGGSQQVMNYGVSRRSS